LNALKIFYLGKNQEDFSFRNQIEKASVSIMNNIAEGYERQTNNEFRQFLYIAKGSCGEVRSMLYIAKDVEKISDIDFIKLQAMTIEISKLLSGLIKAL